MGISVSWCNDEHPVICMTFDRRYSWADVDAAIKSAMQMIEETSQSPAVILDMRTLRSLHNDTLIRLPRIAMQLPKVPPRIIAVGARHNIANMLDIFSKLYAGIQQVATMEEAEHLLRQPHASTAHLRLRIKSVREQKDTRKSSSR